MGWDGTGINCYGIGWDRKICPMDKPVDTSDGAVTPVEIQTKSTSPGMKGFSQSFSIIFTTDCTVHLSHFF